MATLHELQWEIQQELHQLIRTSNREVLYKLAAECQDEMEEDLPGDNSTEVELFDFIVDFVRSKQLKRLEDQGMSRLLTLRDLMYELQATQGTGRLRQASDKADTANVAKTGPTVAASEMIPAPTPVVADQTQEEGEEMKVVMLDNITKADEREDNHSHLKDRTIRWLRKKYRRASEKLARHRWWKGIFLIVLAMIVIIVLLATGIVFNILPSRTPLKPLPTITP